MTFNLPSYRIADRKTFAETVAIADQVRVDAEAIAKGGVAAAREYAVAWKAKFAPEQEWQDGRLARLGGAALRCARNIVERGTSWWVHASENGHQMLMVATLTADASAGAIGFMPLTAVRTDETGNALDYEARTEAGDMVWRAATDPTLFNTQLKLCGLSQAEAAEVLEVNVSTVKHWSAGRRGVPPGVTATLARLLADIEEAADGATSAEDAQMRSAGLPAAAVRAAVARYALRH